MTLLCSTVINEARDLHPALSETAAPVPIALRLLGRFTREFTEAIAVRVPAFVAVQATFSLPLATFASGVSLTTLIPGGWKDLTDLFYVFSDTTITTKVRSHFIPWEQRDIPQRMPAHTFLNNVLYLLGDASDYTSYGTGVLTYTAMPAAFTADTDAIPLPDDALSALSALLAAYWLRRLAEDPAFGTVSPATVAMYMGDAERERQRFLTRIWRTTQRQDYVIRDVQGTGGGNIL